MTTLIMSGLLERIVEVGTRTHEDWSRVPKGGRGSPTIVFNGLYTEFEVATGTGNKSVRYEGIILPDSIGSQVEVYKGEKKKTKPARGLGSRSEEDEDSPKSARIQIHDLTLLRWYR